MFKPKNTLTTMNSANFGVGSILKLSLTQRWLLVAESDSAQISLVNIETFRVSIDKVTVEDINYVSEQEAREITKLTNLNYVFSDFDFDSKGLKLQQ